MDVSALSTPQKEALVKQWQQRNSIQTIELARSFNVVFETNCGSCILTNLDNYFDNAFKNGQLKRN